ncbi:ABC transporter ATP-binding protein [candidate division KSB1 bacterium]|nr:ABC transporter ATP-binding protein [candidate division KSB1 bacterium]
MEHAIRVIGLTKKFLKQKSNAEYFLQPFQKLYVTALDNVSFDLPHGELLCLLGENGAGKSTLIKTLCSLIWPTSGYAFVNGFNVTRNDVQHRRQIGYVICDERSFYWRLSGRRNLQFFASLYKLPTERINRRIDELVEWIGLSEAIDQRFKGYSSGMRQKLAIVRGLMHDPDIIFMDEPSKSLDPNAAHNLQELIKYEIVAKHGKTVLLATHNLQEAEALNHRIILLHKGKIQAFGTMPEILTQSKCDSTYVIKLTNPHPDLPAKIVALPGYLRQRPETNSILAFEFNMMPHNASEIIRQVVEWDGSVVSCYAQVPTLQDIYRTFIGDS